MSDTIIVRDRFGAEVFRWVVPEGEIRFVRASLEGARLDGAELPAEDFTGADLYWASFFEANLAGARFDKACLRGADLKGANLRGASFEEADLGRDNLNGATQLQGADLTGCTLSTAKLEGAEYDAQTRLPSGFSAKKAGMVRVAG